jgi:hypothetical protein
MRCLLMKIPLPANVELKNDPATRFVILTRGIPTTLNTPALDPVLMLDGRHLLVDVAVVLTTSRIRGC